jgi:hypothetical protein
MVGPSKRALPVLPVLPVTHLARPKHERQTAAQPIPQRGRGIQMASPLSADDLKTINEQLAALKTADAEIKRAKLAGIDVSAEETQVSDLTGQLQKIKAAYFPGK